MKGQRYLALILIFVLCKFDLHAYDFMLNGVGYTICSVENLEVSVAHVSNVDSVREIVIPTKVKFKDLEFNVTAIDDNVFSNSKNLTYVDLGDVQSIGRRSFYKCSELKSIDLSHVQEIQGSAFYSCTSLQTIDLTEVISIGSYAFSDCKNLTSVVNSTKLKDVGSCSFLHCSNLSSIDLQGVESISNDAFGQCVNLRFIDLGNVKTIGTAAFAGCGGLESLDLQSAKTIGNAAFRDCFGLKYVNAEVLENLQFNAFIDCGRLESINLGQVSSIRNDTFKGCSSLRAFDFSMIQSIGRNAFSGCSALYSADLSNISTPTIGDGAFQGCSSLNFVKLGSIKSIGDNTFMGCSGLDSIDFKQVKKIGDSAFSGCAGLKFIDFKQVQQIGNSAFSGCAGLKFIDFKQVQQIGNSAFSGCTNLRSVDFRNLHTISECAFSSCIGIDSLDFKNVHSIGNSAFSDCSGLKCVDLKFISNLGKDCFSNCSSLVSIKTYQENPPYIYGETSFDKEVYFNATVLVPMGSKSHYSKAYVWKKFFNIIESLDLGKRDISFSCSQYGSIVIDDEQYSNTNFVKAYLIGSQIKIFIRPNTGSRLKSIFINGLDMTSNVRNGVLLVEVDQPLSIKVVFERETFIINDQKDIFKELSDTELLAISYIREFSDLNWRCLYIPFAMQYEDWKDQFDVAYLNDVHQYDDDDNGTIDRTELEIIRVTKGGIEANIPYLIRAKETGMKTLSLSNVTLKAAQANSINCSSTSTMYTFIGTYNGLNGQEMVDNKFYTMGNGRLIYVEDPQFGLGGFRWYLSITDRYGMPCSASKKIEIVEVGGDTTGIYQIQKDSRSFDIYDINGRLVKKSTNNFDGLKHGIYIINGRKKVL